MPQSSTLTKVDERNIRRQGMGTSQSWMVPSKPSCLVSPPLELALLQTGLHRLVLRDRIRRVMIGITTLEGDLSRWGLGT